MADLIEQLFTHGVDAASFEWLGAAPELGHLTVPGRDAIARWRQLRALAPTLHRYPVLVGEEEALERLEDWLEDAAGQPAPVHGGAPLDAAAWAQAQLEEQAADMRRYGEEEGAARSTPG